MPNTSILPSSENDPVDAPAKFRNIDNEPFVCTSFDNITYTVQPGEVITKAKYVVNYLAMHLARKMYKRKVLSEFVGTEHEKANANIRLVNPEEEIKLQKMMVADNFTEIPKEPEIKAPELQPEPISEPIPNLPITPEIKKEEEKKPEEVSWKCEVCGFIAKNKVGLLAHKRFRHPQPKI